MIVKQPSNYWKQHDKVMVLCIYQHDKQKDETNIHKFLVVRIKDASIFTSQEGLFASK